MESALKPVDGSQDCECLYEYNEARKSLKADSHCFTLVRPMFEEKNLMVLNQISVGPLNSFNALRQVGSLTRINRYIRVSEKNQEKAYSGAWRVLSNLTLCLSGLLF